MRRMMLVIGATVSCTLTAYVLTRFFGPMPPEIVTAIAVVVVSVIRELVAD